MTSLIVEHKTNKKETKTKQKPSQVWMTDRWSPEERAEGHMHGEGWGTLGFWRRAQMSGCNVIHHLRNFNDAIEQRCLNKTNK